MKFGFVVTHRAIWPVERICEALGVSRSGCYAWMVRPESAHAKADAIIGVDVRASFVLSDRAYGARRVLRDVRDAGHACGLHRIERLMREQPLRARPRRKALPLDTGDRSRHALAANVLDRDLVATAPNQKWVADFTYAWTSEGWLYVAVVIDLFARRAVGWSMQATMTTRLVTDALIMAVWRRGDPQALVHHSDRGSQYSCESFQRLLRELGVTCSMSRAGNVWDNSVMERFFFVAQNRTSRAETLHHPQCRSRGCVRLYRALLQSDPEALHPGLRQPD